MSLIYIQGHTGIRNQKFCIYLANVSVYLIKVSHAAETVCFMNFFAAQLFLGEKNTNKQAHKQTHKHTRNQASKQAGKQTIVCLFVGCLTSQQHASVFQGRICSDNFTCCHTEIEVADQTFHLTQSQYTDAGSTSPSADPITPGAWHGSHWSANV